MAPPEPLPIALNAERDRTIDELSLRFAHDALSIEELERRLELAYRATTVAELRALTADLAPPAATVPATVPARSTALGAPPDEFVERGRMLSIMSDSKRRGPWVVPHHMELVSVMASTTLDFTEALLPPGIVDLHVRGLMTEVKLIVPPDVYVVNRASSVMSNVEEDTDVSPPPGAPVIRLSGWVTMSNVVVKVRRRELPR